VGRCRTHDGQYVVYVRGGIYTAQDPAGDGTFISFRGPYGGPSQQKAMIGYPGQEYLLCFGRAADLHGRVG